MSGYKKGLEQADGTPIENLNADFTSKWYSFGEFLHMALHLGWDNIAAQGNLFLDYSCDPDGVIYTVKNDITLDGTFNEQMFLDANLAISNYRLRYVRISGNANLEMFHNNKRGI